MSKEQINSDRADPGAPGPSTQALSAAGNARRRFTRRAGAGSAGVLMTLASAPGMATDALNCMAPSRQLSQTINNSARPNTGLACSGVGPLSWAKTYSPCVPRSARDDVRLRDVLPCGTSTDGAYFLKDIVCNGVNTTTGVVSALDDKGEFGRALVVAYLNVSSGKISFLTQESLVSMYVDMTTTMRYRVDATTSWDMVTLTKYLKQTYRAGS
ncbi:hypothetical protein [Massilia sp. DWR3-1-1]|uniref:hypothetical protein n=1 Tax=Massilia sp. DWR3-1-1 TaxID=2804559 RepID=UPI003CF25A1E